MRTDVQKINEQTPHQELTEGLMMFAGEHPDILKRESGEPVRRCFMRICADSVCCARRSVPIPVFR